MKDSLFGKYALHNVKILMISFSLRTFSGLSLQLVFGQSYPLSVFYSKFKLPQFQWNIS